MKKNRLVLVLFLFCSIVFGQKYPVAQAVPNVTTKFNIPIQDDYSWMEDMRSDATNSWVNAQNELINAHYEEIKKQYDIATKLKDYNYNSTNGLPSKREAYYYSIYTRDQSKPSVLYFRKDLNDMAIELFNPYKIYKNTTAALSDYSPSKNSKYIACKVSLDGSDRTEIRFVDITKIKNIDDKIENVKFSKMVWNQDAGVFYKKNSNQDAFAKDSTYQLYYHKIGTVQDSDKLVFDASKTQNNFTYFTKNDRLFIVEYDRKNDSKNFYSAFLNDSEFKLEKFIANDTTDFSLLHYNNNKVYFSGKEFDWGEIRTFDIADRSSETLLIPQIYNNLLAGSYFMDGYIFCKYRTINQNYLIVYDESGKFIKRIDTPEGTDFDVKFFDPKSKSLFISIFSKTISYKNFKLNIETGEVTHFYNDYIVPKPVLFDSDHFVTKKIAYKSRDGKEVPITIIYKKETVMNGNNPTLLEAYGGFGIVSELAYDTGLLYFLEKGGVYAYAEIRGGGEKGLKWHKDGMGLKKQNTFNDFIDAAEFLIKEKYTSPNKLAISGGSNGGLVVGVAMTQRPELFKVAIPVVGVFDMNKFNNYTVGNHWVEEYGNPEKKAEFESLMSYSPYHNIKEDINYPITLIITSENDDRVVPMHSFKFAARLQNRKSQKNAIYLKTLDDSGHSGKRSNYNNYFEEKAFFYSFLLYHLNRKDS